MNRPLTKTLSLAALALAAILLAGSLYLSEKASVGKSRVASPYDKVGQAPTSPPKGINAITGEPLPETAKQYMRESQRLHSSQQSQTIR